jgi:methionyl aminopeptidase
MAKLKSPQDIQKMREAGQLAGRTLSYIAPYVKPGISTEEINTLVHNFIVEHKAYPSPLKYGGTRDRVPFPKSVCTSVNSVVCHGIPDANQILQDGDIVNIDVTVTLNGYFGDTSKTFFVGTNISEERRRVTNVAEESLARAIAIVKHGCRLGDIGWAIQEYAEKNKCGVVRDFVGHGIGKVFHEEPAILHYGKPNTGEKLVRGMCFTIEPMINAGDWRTKMWNDGWTAATYDGKDSAQFEHTLAIVGEGVEVLTALPGDTILLRAQELSETVFSCQSHTQQMAP